MGATFVLKDLEVDHYLLDINNKYYTAQVLLCTSEKLPSDLSDFEALIFHRDLETVGYLWPADLIGLVNLIIKNKLILQEDHIRLLDEQILPLLSQSEAEVLLLVCDSVADVSIREKGLEIYFYPNN